MADIRRDLTRTTLAILCLLLLIGGSLWVLRPFLGALVWATMIVVATWPLLTGLQQRFRGRRAPAVAVMTLGMLLLLFIPLLLAVDIIASHATEVATLVRKLASTGLPQPPDWVAGLPLLGGKLHDLWAQLADAGSQALLQKVEPYAAESGRWLLSKLGNVGFMLIQFLLIVILSAVLYAGGEAAAATAQALRTVAWPATGRADRWSWPARPSAAWRSASCVTAHPADGARRHRPGDRRRALRRRCFPRSC
jgi:predicted PurR-regulated permease PerM